MKDHLQGIIGNASTLIDRYKVNTSSPTGVNKVLQGLTHENIKLQKEVIKLNRELKTAQWLREKGARATNKTKGSERNRSGPEQAEYPRGASSKETAMEIGSGDQNRMGRMGLSPTVIGNAAVLPLLENADPAPPPSIPGLTSEQFDALVRAVAAAVGAALPPSRHAAYADAVLRKEKHVRSEEEQTVLMGKPRKSRPMGVRQKEIETPYSTETPLNDRGMGEEWQVATRRKRRPNPHRDGDTAPPKRNRQDNRRRVPETVAISLSRGNNTKPLCDTVKMIRTNNKINLRTLGIEEIHTRSAQAGGIIIEIPKADGGEEKAARLISEMKTHIPEDIQIRSLSKTGSVRIAGFDRSIEADDIRDCITEATGCPANMIRVGKLAWNSRTGSVVVQLPIEPALKLASLKKIGIGWSMVSIRMMEDRPVQCFRCLEFGHLRKECKATIDRSSLCYRCGEEGHVAAQCRSDAPACVICGPEVESHRMGGAKCTALKKATSVNRRREVSNNKHRNG